MICKFRRDWRLSYRQLVNDSSLYPSQIQEEQPVLYGFSAVERDLFRQLVM